MRHITIFFLICIISTFFSETFANTYIEKKVGDYKVKFVQYNISSDEYNIRIGVSKDATTLENIMNTYNGVTAINGVFFCPSDYSACNGKSFTINERYIEGEKIGPYDDTGDRVVFGWDYMRHPFLFQTGKINPDKEKDIFEGFANHPLILKGGENMLEHYHDVNLIDNKMRTKMTRNFICSDKDKKYIYFGLVYDITLDDEGPVLDALGCYDALNLDAGKSTAFIYNGKYIAGPGRNILDAIIIERKGLNTSEIKKKTLSNTNKILSKIEKKSRKNKIIALEKIVADLKKEKTYLYSSHSRDILDEEGKIIGYKTEIESLEILKKIYTINISLETFSTQLSKLKKSLTP